MLVKNKEFSFELYLQTFISNISHSLSIEYSFYSIMFENEIKHIFFVTTQIFDRKVIIFSFIYRFNQKEIFYLEKEFFIKQENNFPSLHIDLTLGRTYATGDTFNYSHNTDSIWQNINSNDIIILPNEMWVSNINPGLVWNERYKICKQKEDKYDYTLNLEYHYSNFLKSICNDNIKGYLVLNALTSNKYTSFAAIYNKIDLLNSKLADYESFINIINTNYIDFIE